MSDTAQGPDWWLASDGKWYPPQAPPPGAPPSGYAAPPPGYAGPAPYPAPAKKGKGCLIAVIIVVALIVVGGIALVVIGGLVARRVAENAFGSGPCPFLDDEQASAVLGEGTTVIKLQGLAKVLNVLDARVMPDDPSCALTRDDTAADGGSSGGLGRIARYRGADAADKYDEELTKANGITEDRGNGLSVTSDKYFNRTVEDFGDEAFCTKSSGVGAGVLVRDGNTLVYVSVVADVGAVPGIDLSDPNNAKLGTDDLHCELAQVIASKILG